MMFRKIFSKLIKPWQIFLVSVGSFAGLLMLWVPIQSYFDISSAMKSKKDLFGDHFLVLNKTVSVFSALGWGSGGFTAEEINALKSEKGVNDIGAFTANTFHAMASADFGDNGPVVKTEMFFEAVPNQFLDERPMGWNWSPESDEVPIIVPSDYLALYNFGFAPGQNLPQISQDLAKLSGFTIVISGSGKERVFKGRIAGFSDRINTILAPLNFITFCNETYGAKAPPDPSRIIVEASDITALAEVMKSKGYESNQEALKSGRIQSVANRILTITLAIGALIVLLSLGSFLQFADLLIARSDFEIRTLSYQGYDYKKISAIIFRQVFVFVAISAALALLAGIAIRWFLLKYMSVLVENPTAFPKLISFVIFFSVMAFYLAIAYWNIVRQTKRLSGAY